MFVIKSIFIYTCTMRKYAIIISTALFFVLIFDACKRGPGTCGDGKENGDETSLDCGPTCKLCPPPIAPEGNYIIGRISEKFFTEQKDPNITTPHFRVGNEKYEMYSTAGFYKTKTVGVVTTIQDTNIIIGISQTFSYDTAKVPTAVDFIARIDSGYQQWGGLTLNNEVSKDGFFIIYKNKAKIADSNVVYTTYFGEVYQPGSYLKVKNVKLVSENTYNIIGEYQATVYNKDKSKRIYIDKGRFNLKFKLK
jgi:hypothetical protein